MKLKPYIPATLITAGPAIDGAPLGLVLAVAGVCIAVTMIFTGEFDQ